MAIDISDVLRRVVYAPNGTGPYQFTFEVLTQTDIAVYRGSTLLTLTTDYTVSLNVDGTGSVTLVATAGTENVTIVGDRGIARSTDFVTGGDLLANSLNDELDAQTIFNQQTYELALRGLKAPVYDPTDINMTLPTKAARAGKTLAFDNDGNPVTGEVIGDNRGNWAADVAYNKRDIVKDASNGNVYYANTAHTSSGTTPISSNTDSAKWDLIVDNASAGASATAAAASATAAAGSASAASTSASNAASSASTASTQASNASTSASNASSSASTASTAATNAGNSATAAAGSASAASTSATNASNSASAASTSASNASSSASAAATSETNAASSASAASTSASNAASSASAASTSATNAASSATSAQTAQAAAEAALDSFTDIYLGAFSSDPTLDNDGNALTAGDLYFNTVSNRVKVYSGSAWGFVSVDPALVVEKTSDIGSAKIPNGTTAERDGSPATGFFRFNSSLSKFEGYNGSAWGSVGGGATGGGSDDIFIENGQTVTTNYTLSTGKNALSAGPISIASGVTVTVPSGQVWTIV
jgi:hypothetical protein